MPKPKQLKTYYFYKNAVTCYSYVFFLLINKLSTCILNDCLNYNSTGRILTFKIYTFITNNFHKPAVVAGTSKRNHFPKSMLEPFELAVLTDRSLADVWKLLAEIASLLFKLIIGVCDLL